MNIFIKKIFNFSTEIYYRLFFSFISFVTVFLTIFYFRIEFLFFILKPLLLVEKQEQLNLSFLSLNEVFETYLLISISFSLLTFIFIFIFQIYSFLSEAMYNTEKQILILVLSTIYFLVFLSIFFSYTYLIPTLFDFFIYFHKTNFTFINLNFLTQLKSYSDLFFSISLKLLIIPIIPLIITVITLISNVKIYKITNSRKFLHFFCLVIATILSSSDILSQVIIWVLLAFVLENSFFINFLIYEYRKTG